MTVMMMTRPQPQTASFTMDGPASRWTNREARQFTKLMTRRRRCSQEVPERATSLLDEACRQARMQKQLVQTS